MTTAVLARSPANLDDYFEFEQHDSKFGPVQRIRIKGHRISIEHVIELFNAGVPPDTIVREYYQSLSLEEAYATITYYLRNRDQVDEYIRHSDEIGEKYYQEHLRNGPHPIEERLRSLKAERLLGKK